MSRRRTTGPTVDHPSGSVKATVHEIVRAELDAAAHSYVCDLNLVATHLLMSAAHEMMRGYAVKRGIRLQADLHAYLKDAVPDDADDLINALNSPYNGMKHARTTEGVIFHPDFTQIGLYHAIGDYLSLFRSKPTKRMAIFFAWFLAARTKVNDHTPPGKRPLFPSARLDGPWSLKLTEARKLMNASAPIALVPDISAPRPETF